MDAGKSRRRLPICGSICGLELPMQASPDIGALGIAGIVAANHSDNGSQPALLIPQWIVPMTVPHTDDPTQRRGLWAPSEVAFGKRHSADGLQLHGITPSLPHSVPRPAGVEDNNPRFPSKDELLETVENFVEAFSYILECPKLPRAISGMAKWLESLGSMRSQCVALPRLGPRVALQRSLSTAFDVLSDLWATYS